MHPISETEEEIIRVVRGLIKHEYRDTEAGKAVMVALSSAAIKQHRLDALRGNN